MPSFGKRSKKHYDTLHPKLQRIMDEAIKYVDFSILEGVRTPERQQELMAQGKTKTLNSKHLPDLNGKSRAVDIIAYPIQWENWNRNYLFAGYILGIASSLGIKIRLGADWKGNLQEHQNQTFFDLPHIELDDSEV